MQGVIFGHEFGRITDIKIWAWRLSLYSFS